MRMSQTGSTLFTETQQRVLTLLYGQPERSFYTNEILRLTGMGVGTVKRELERMHKAGILTLRKSGNQLHYQANPQCPIFSELIGIVKKTFGLVNVLQHALASMAQGIEWAFVFGSVASGKESATSDVDLLIIGDVDFTDTVSALYPAQEILGREINPKIFGKNEWRRLLKKNDAFVKELMQNPRMDVIGEWSEP